MMFDMSFFIIALIIKSDSGIIDTCPHPSLPPANVANIAIGYYRSQFNAMNNALHLAPAYKREHIRELIGFYVQASNDYEFIFDLQTCDEIEFDVFPEHGNDFCLLHRVFRDGCVVTYGNFYSFHQLDRILQGNYYKGP